MVLGGGFGHPTGQTAGHEAVEFGHVEEARFDELVRGEPARLQVMVSQYAAAEDHQQLVALVRVRSPVEDEESVTSRATPSSSCTSRTAAARGSRPSRRTHQGSPSRPCRRA